MKVCLGGTFEPFHAGHEALLRAAAQGAGSMFVGVTDGPLARRGDRPVSPWPQRAARVEAFLRQAGYQGRLEAAALTDPMGPAATGDFDAIAASPETVQGAEAINAARVAAGRPPLRLIRVPHVLGQDLLPISGTAVAEGRIDARGRRLRPVQVAVGSGVPEQPRGAETLAGARLRARKAREAWPECDYAVGVEAGLIRFPEGTMHLEAQACVVVDRNGWETHGWGPGFEYPAWVTERALRGEMVSAILGPVADDPRIGSTTGAIGYLSGGRLDRTALTRQAVLMAFVPRIRRDLYLGPEPQPKALVA